MPMDVKLSSIQSRLDSSREALQRSRTAFWILVIISLTMIFAGFNQYFSWDRDFALANDFPKVPVTNEANPITKVPVTNEANPITKEVYTQLLDEWTKNQTISIGLLGIRVSSDDASFIGSIGLIIISYWLLFCTRRVNHTIALLLRDTKEESYDVLEMIFHGIISHLVFLAISTTDHPIESLEKETEPPDSKKFEAKASFKYLYFLPTLSIVFLVFGDMLSIFYLDAPFRLPHTPLWRHLQLNDWIQIVFYDLLALIIAVWCAFVCRNALNYEEATGKILKSYGDLLKSKKSPPGGAPEELNEQP